MPQTFEGLRTVIYPSPDLPPPRPVDDRCSGLPPYFEEPFYVGFEVAGYELGLLPDGDPADGALTYWGVADVDEAVAAALEAGATVHAAPSEVGDGIVTATVRSPQGAIVGFIRNPHFALPS